MSWTLALGLGLLWQGLLILWVGGIPLAIAAPRTPRPDKGTPEAFSFFWLEQYRFIGLTLAIAGAGLAIGAHFP